MIITPYLWALNINAHIIPKPAGKSEKELSDVASLCSIQALAKSGD
jgi:hypothetical protein